MAKNSKSINHTKENKFVELQLDELEFVVGGVITNATTNGDSQISGPPGPPPPPKDKGYSQGSSLDD